MNESIRKMTCIVCPMGCNLEVRTHKGEFTVTGNKCKRGKSYANREMTSPVRTLTTTVFLTPNGVLPVKTSGAIPKERVQDVIKELKSISVSPPVLLNQLIVPNILNLGVDVISTMEIE